MSTREDMLDCERRDADGYPYPAGPITRPRATVRSDGAPLTSHVDQSVEIGNNKPLPWIAISLVVTSISMLIAGYASAKASWAQADAQRAERESRMLEMYVLELDAKLIAAGYKTDAEALAKKLREHKR